MMEVSVLNGIPSSFSFSCIDHVLHDCNRVIIESEKANISSNTGDDNNGCTIGNISAIRSSTLRVDNSHRSTSITQHSKGMV